MKCPGGNRNIRRPGDFDQTIVVTPDTADRRNSVREHPDLPDTADRRRVSGECQGVRNCEFTPPGWVSRVEWRLWYNPDMGFNTPPQLEPRGGEKWGSVRKVVIRDVSRRRGERASDLVKISAIWSRVPTSRKVTTPSLASWRIKCCFSSKCLLRPLICAHVTIARQAALSS